jgi:hypothetical protein
MANTHFEIIVFRNRLVSSKKTCRYRLCCNPSPQTATFEFNCYITVRTKPRQACVSGRLFRQFSMARQRSSADAKWRQVKVSLRDFRHINPRVWEKSVLNHKFRRYNGEIKIQV